MQRTFIRESLAEYYDTTTANIKNLINAVTYGQSIENNEWFDKNKIQIIRHHNTIIEYAKATERAANALMKDNSPDYLAAKQANPESNHRSLTFKALSALITGALQGLLDGAVGCTQEVLGIL